MHTQWQRKILRVLKETFPNIQFLVTTHSPQVLGETGEDYNIITLKKEGMDIIINQYDSMYGWDSNAILEERMETPSLSAGIKQLVEKMYEALEAKDYDNAQAYADQVDEVTNGRNDSAAKVRILIAKGRRHEKNRQG